MVKRMRTKHVILLAEKSLQSSLIEKQLSSIPNVNVQTLLPEEVLCHSHTLSVDLVFVEYDFMRQHESRGTLPAFDLFDWPLMIHNVPTESIQTDLFKWKLLKGVLLKSASVAHITEGIEYILEGGLWLPRVYLERMVCHYRHSSMVQDRDYDDLTSRERQILELLAHGISNQQIASQLFLSESTVKSHIYKLYKKLDVHSRHDAIKMTKVDGRLTAQ